MRSKKPAIFETTKILHPMESFGSVSGLTEHIRINLLSKRLDPSVPFPHKHDFYQILLVAQGKGWHEIDFSRYPVHPGAVFIMQPAEVHAWGLDDDCEGYVIEFNKSSLRLKDPYFHGFQQKLRLFPQAPKIKPSRFESLLACAAYSYEEYRKRELNFSMILLTELMKMLLLIERALPKSLEADSPSHAFFDEFEETLEKNFRLEHSASFYAQELGISARALSMRFQRMGLKPPSEYIAARCLLEAKRLLAYSHYTIQEVGEHLGFDDPNYFARFFRKQAGMSPGQFRSQA